MAAGFARATYGSEKWAGSARIAYRKAGDIQTPEGRVPGTSMDNFGGSFGWGINHGNLTGGASLSLVI
jgi:iron complex outermembrane recepter protein